jgi:CO dehydrogenase/acetyl-CoA synthase beta subunit
MNHVHSAENKEGVCDICDSLKETEERRNRPYENEFEQWIHENIMKDCWHNLVYDAFKKMDSCTKCGTSVTYMWGGSRAGVNNYRYTTSLDAAAEVEKKTIKSTGRINLRKALMDVIAEDLALEFKGSFPAGLIVEEATFATAEQRARACKSAWESRVCKSA